MRELKGMVYFMGVLLLCQSMELNQKQLTVTVTQKMAEKKRCYLDEAVDGIIGKILKCGMVYLWNGCATFLTCKDYSYA